MSFFIIQYAMMKTIDMLYEKMTKFDRYNIIPKDEVYVSLSQNCLKTTQEARNQSFHNYNSLEFNKAQDNLSGLFFGSLQLKLT